MAQLKNCAIRQKVACSILEVVTCIFNDIILLAALWP